ncbi:PrpF domain-containing protein [Streptomyces sp. CT34]|uniref:2-methylaconitate cis-trans isomerase PrpF family protein n=1 Tax=Streptomyces sp. CT34 TaxID=1553907 RepID=UPI0005BE9C72|nr:PrpF domain-containing protein [Streptomyces sp. CT34]
MMLSVPAMLMRGGTSKGLYLTREAVDDTGVPPEVLLPALLGSPDPRQIDGIGGAQTTTSKVAIIEPSTRPGIDVDYLFAQVDIATDTVDWTPTCGNLLTGVGAFAIERGMVPVAGDVTEVRVHLVNTGADVLLTVQTPGGAVRYDGETAVDGVPGGAAPVGVTFTEFTGGTTGSLFPTGNPRDVIDGVEVSCVDAGVAAVLMRAADLGVTGAESPTELDADRALLERIEFLRRQAGKLMGMGDVAGRVVPKVMLLSPSEDATIRSRYFVPTSCHPAHAVSGAVCLGSALAMPGTVARDVAPHVPESGDYTLEHPSGVIRIGIAVDGGRPVGASVVRTARKLFDGMAFAELAPAPLAVAS